MSMPSEASGTWDPEAFKRRIAAMRQRAREKLPPLPDTPYHQAPAVDATFDPTGLGTHDGPVPPGADLKRLLDDAEAVRAPGGPYPWALKPAPRVKALQSFPDRASLREALDWNSGSEGDPVQRYLSGLIRG